MKKKKRADGVAQVVEHMSSKQARETLSLNPVLQKKKKKIILIRANNLL
jgi:hypothetical protein